jgi:hypothetical protein
MEGVGQTVLKISRIGNQWWASPTVSKVCVSVSFPDGGFATTGKGNLKNGGNGPDRFENFQDPSKYAAGPVSPTLT